MLPKLIKISHGFHSFICDFTTSSVTDFNSFQTVKLFDGFETSKASLKRHCVEHTAKLLFLRLIFGVINIQLNGNTGEDT